MIAGAAAGPVPMRSFRTASRARTLLAFTGIAPLGAFVVVHLITTATALLGAARFERVFAPSPALTIASVILVVVPLAFHAAYGAWVAIAKPYAVELPAWWPRTRRLASFVVLAFVVGHLAELGLPRWGGAIRAPSLFDVTAAHLSATTWGIPFVALGYLVGVAATLFHFATSMWTFLTTWGLVVARRRALAWGLGVTASLLFVVGANTIVYLATGNRLIGPSPPAFVPDGPPPANCGPQP